MEPIKYTPYRAFGWIVIKAECADGRAFTVKVSREGARSESANFTLHTSGVLNARCLTDDLPMIPQRLPGMSTKDLNSLRAGEFEFSAQGDARWWCVNWLKNEGKLPELEPVVMTAGTSRTFPIGSRLFLGEGAATVNGSAIELPSSVKASTQDIEVICSADTYGFLFL